MADPNDKVNRVLETIRTLQSQSDDVKAAAEAMKEQVDVWKKAMAEWSKLEDRIAENIANAPNMITLDVGGTLFKTSKDTLLRFEGSYFHALLGSGKWKPDSSNDAYTLDLNGGIPFQRVMDYLRSGQLSMSGLNDWEVQQTRSILDYLKISDTKWAWDGSLPLGNLALTCDGRTIEMQRAMPSGGSSAIGDRPTKMVKMRLDSGASNIIVGLAPREGFNSSSTPAYQHGYSIHLGNGAMYNFWQDVKPSPRKSSFTKGDELRIRQLKDGIQFERNGHAVGFISLDASSPELFPIISMWTAGDKMTIID